MNNSVEEKQKQAGGETEPNQPSGASQSKSTIPKSTNQQKIEQEQPATEHGGCKGPEPTRYGDWEHNGRCTDF